MRVAAPDCADVAGELAESTEPADESTRVADPDSVAELPIDPPCDVADLLPLSETAVQPVSSAKTTSDDPSREERRAYTMILVRSGETIPSLPRCRSFCADRRRRSALYWSVMRIPTFAPLLGITLLSALGVQACRKAEPDRPASPPAAEFVLSAGDSTFWVTSTGGSARVRGAPLELARVDGRFYEIYVADDDRSYEDAELVGERIYRRDLVSGDSLLIFEDTIVPHLARLYARLHPDDQRIGPEDDGNDDPLWRANTTIEIADVHGPFLSYTLHADVERDDAPLWHTSRRGVIDLTSGREATLSRIAGRDEASITRRRSVVAASMLDSVRSGGDRIDRARTAQLLDAYRLDPRSFVLTTVDGQPAVAYALSGQGAGEEGHLLALPPIPLGEPDWWTAAASSLPVSSADGTRDVWRHGRYDVVTRNDSGGRSARIVLRDSTSREWVVGHVPAPARRIFWLDDPPVDSTARRALTRAFDESVLYDESVRSASRRVGDAHTPATLATARRRRLPRTLASHGT